VPANTDDIFWSMEQPREERPAFIQKGIDRLTGNGQALDSTGTQATIVFVARARAPLRVAGILPA